MKQDWEQLYSLMLIDFNRCNSLVIPETEKAEGCFRIANNYWDEVKSRFIKRVMQIDSEEIEFFREVKPRFTSHIEYYLVLSQGLLFIPEGACEKIKYWEDEGLRFERFVQRNREFVNYYESNEIDREAAYFLKRNNGSMFSPHENIYNDIECRSSHDHLVRSLLANQMYHEYVRNKLAELKHEKIMGSGK